jgi:hypothetical protein
MRHGMMGRHASCGATLAVVGFPACALLGTCAQLPPRLSKSDPIRAAFVVLGEEGAPIARVITAAAACPELVVDGLARAMAVRAPPGTVPLRPTRSAPADSKPSAFPDPMYRTYTAQIGEAFALANRRPGARDRQGRLFTTCALRDGKTRCAPEVLP